MRPRRHIISRVKVRVGNDDTRVRHPILGLGGSLDLEGPEVDSPGKGGEGRPIVQMDKGLAAKTWRLAWEGERANGGAAGVDRISIERFEAPAERYLVERQADLEVVRHSQV